MPLYEYKCRGCGEQFETLVRSGDTPACPSCSGTDLERILSMFGVSSASIRASNLAAGRAQHKKDSRDKNVAQAEYERKHRDD